LGFKDSKEILGDPDGLTKEALIGVLVVKSQKNSMRYPFSMKHLEYCWTQSSAQKTALRSL
jgi:hypothetical protein